MGTAADRVGPGCPRAGGWQAGRVGEQVEVREAGGADVAAISEFFGLAWAQAGPDAPGFAGATEESIEAIRAPKAIRRAIGGPARRMFIARAGGTVVGFAATTRIDRERIELAGIVVLPAQAGHGVGGRLVGAALRSALECGFRQMTVRTEVDNTTALRFYQAHGFVPVGAAVELVEGTEVPVTVLARDVADPTSSTMDG